MSDLIWINDGPPPARPVVTVTATDGVGTEQLDAPDFTYTFTRTGDLSQTLFVNYVINPTGGAVAGDDFTHPTGMAQVMFMPGSATTTLTFDAIDDGLFEGPEFFSLLLAGGLDYDVGVPSTASGMIVDNDSAPIVSVRETNSGAENVNGTTTVVNEGSTLHFTFNRTGNIDNALTISYNLRVQFRCATRAMSC